MTQPTAPMWVSFASDSPEEIEEVLRPVGPCDVQHFGNGPFHTELTVTRLNCIDIGFVRMSNGRVTNTESSNIGLNFPVAGQFTGGHPPWKKVYIPGDGYIANSRHPLDLRVGDSSCVLVCNFNESLLDAYAMKYNDSKDTQHIRELSSNYSTETRSGAFFYRYLNFIWAELNQAAGFIQPPIATKEIEDSLLALFIAGIYTEEDDDRDRLPICLRLAEEYITAHLTMPLSLADIAAYAGISVPTLSRVFRRHHRLGPKAFLRQRRLEKVQRELLVASPFEKTVTEVAMRYGFYQLSHFARTYQKTFGELPSETLRRHGSKL